MTDDILQSIIATLQETISPEEAQKLQSWRDDSEANEKEYQRIAELWQKSAGLKHLAELDPETDWKLIQAQMKPTSNWRMVGRWAAAAVIIALLGFGAVMFAIFQSNTPDPLATANKAQQFTLSDGTVVHLNKHSELLIGRSFGSSDRSVVLIGEGYFEVAKDTSLPFTIRAGRSQTRVLGTAFNVDAKADEIEIHVDHGHVRFSGRENSIELTKGMAAQLDATDQLHMLPFNPNALAWRTLKLRFEETPILTVLEDLSECYDVEFRTKNLPGDLTYTSTFDQDSLTTVLDELALIHGLDYQQDGSTYIISTSE